MKRKAPPAPKQRAIQSFMTGPGQVECPLCGLMFHQALVERHAAGCGANALGPALTHLAPSQNTQSSPPPVQAEPPGSAPDGSGRDAFSLLRSAQAAKVKQEQQARGTFRVDLLPSGGGVRLLASFVLDSDGPGTQASAPAPKTAWSGESNVRRLLVGGGPQGSERCQAFALTLATNIPPAPACSAPVSSAPPPVHVAVLKSMLQKATRRHKQPHTLRLSAALLEASAADLLRRLSVVAMEDASLHPALPVVVWAMAAQARGYLLPDVLTAAVLHLCAELGAGACRDSELRAPSPPCWRLAELPPGSARTLVWSLALRAAHGGMEGDVRMLEGFSGLWAQRLFVSTREGEGEGEGEGEEADAGAEEALPAALAALLPMALYLHPLSVTPLRRRPWGGACVAAYSCSAAPPASFSTASDMLAAPPCPLRALAACPDLQHLRRGLMRDLSLGNTNSSSSSGSSSGSSGSTGSASQPSVLSALPLRRRDLVAEGLDPHCDSGFLPRLLQRCGAAVTAALAAAEGRGAEPSQEQTPDPSPASSQPHPQCSDAIKSAIWTFRGSTNARGQDSWLRPGGSEDEAARASAWGAERMAEVLAAKRAQAGVWAAVARELGQAAGQRLEELGARLPP